MTMYISPQCVATAAEFLRLCCDYTSVWTMRGSIMMTYLVTSHSTPHSRVAMPPQPPNRETQQRWNYDNNVTAAIIFEFRGQLYFTQQRNF